MSTVNVYADGHFAATPAPRRNWLAVARTQFRVWAARSEQRRSLLQMSDRLLADIGISRDEAEIEGRKPFWKA